MAIDIDYIGKEAKQCFVDFFRGACFKNFADMIPDRKLETIIKVALLAVAAGIICGVVCGTGSSILIAAVVGIGAFSYYTNNNQCGIISTFGDIFSWGFRETKAAFNSL